MNDIVECRAAAGSTQVLTRKDFESEQDVRWCPGCGDYALLAQVQKLLPTLGIPRENFAFVSGIGCSSRFPYYMDTYGIHSIHGRAPAIASGLKLARPELSVWVVTGDGDALAIGGNHFIHAIRRNIGLKIVLLNNRIYGLTKGQFSPTTELGEKTKTSPYGNIDPPFSAAALALGAGATFVARVLDTDLPMLQQVLARAATHPGTAFVEVLQNCIVFNDGAYSTLTDKATRDEVRLTLRHGQPLRFGKNGEHGIRLRGLKPEVVSVAGAPGVAEGEGVAESELAVHDEADAHGSLAFLLAQFAAPEFPQPLGILRAVERPAFEVMNAGIAAAAREQRGPADLASLLAGGDTWTVG
ncbi:2-oxoacid:ferredoxin oxidoreductase subunit beta [Rhodocyclus purpureus]|uniref:2-oxoacid:ferredoxin oxidoreductase subunit beta n=1 Tax=Rhodocyclus purpureus TaxID=1067 RepID=UPI001913E30C|nr:2-oxoacid:ferredoxin oxidoreductase subunit beta [Rhodocyclus purpureus]MBK5915172.1 2-oxoacid:ferredoxin oxidoreductase subunit beta [Rhodocyclus purpureus]